MNGWDVALIGTGLSMDAFAVAASNRMAYRGLTAVRQAAMPAAFALFQVLMPILGYTLGSLFAAWIDRYAGPIIFGILGMIGGKMIWDGLHPETEEASTTDDLPWSVLLIQAAATSIDAFAVGIGFAAAEVPLLSACTLIGLITFMLCWAAVAVGALVGNLSEHRAQIIGGVILLLIGLKSL